MTPDTPPPGSLQARLLGDDAPPALPAPPRRRGPPPVYETCKGCQKAPPVLYHDRCQGCLVRLATKGRPAG